MSDLKKEKREKKAKKEKIEELDLVGSSEEDELEGDKGNDKINGRKGDDVIKAQRGNDDLLGGEGDDILDAGNGKDKVFGGTGNDILDAGNGKDFLVGAVGVATGVTTEVDVLTGGSSKDAFVVGAWGAYTAGGDADYADVADLGHKDTLWLASEAILTAKDALALTADDIAAVSDRANSFVVEGKNVQNLAELTNGLYTLGAAPTDDGSAGVYLNREGVAPELVAVLRGVSTPVVVDQPVEEQPVV